MSTRDPQAADLDALVERIRAAIGVVELVAGDWALLDPLSPEDRARFHEAIARAYHPDPAARRTRVRARERHRKAAGVSRQEARLQDTGIRTLRRQPVFTTPDVEPPPSDFRPDDVRPDAEAGPAAEPIGERHCYICKRHYGSLHHFYDQLCPACAALNHAKRTELADLRGRVALLTGGRVKIGYQAGLKLLRSGAALIVTTRFPRDAAARYARETDFETWRDRLQIFGVDLRHTPSVEALCRDLLTSRDRLDFIVNNACQTVRRPPAFYAHMMAAETAALREMPAPARALLAEYRYAGGAGLAPTPVGAGLAPTPVGAGLAPTPVGAGLARPDSPAELSQVPLLPDDLQLPADLFPQGRLDQDLQQVDLRRQNSWRLLLADVQTVELLEVHLVNAIAPFILNARLKPLLLRTTDRDKHIVNVSAVEGQFYRRFKTTRHPHTNMAKAALNMMTRTAAADYHQDGIHMNSVDTGWVTDEDPEEIAARKTVEQRFHPPLDIVDGAARILDPIIAGFNTGTHVWGQFLKDYRPVDW